MNSSSEEKCEVDQKFSFQQLNELSKICRSSFDQDGKIHTLEFVAVVKEIRKIFNGLGSAFQMAFGDIDDKVIIIEENVKGAKTLAKENVPMGSKLNEPYDATNDMWIITDWEVANNTGDNNDKKLMKGSICHKAKDQTVFRAINRMVKVCELVIGLLKSLKADKTLEVSTGLKNVYPDTLGKIHPTMVYYGATACFSFVPSRKDFLKSLDAKEEDVQSQFDGIWMIFRFCVMRCRKRCRTPLTKADTTLMEVTGISNK